MATEELLDLKGIDAVLGRFRARRSVQVDLAQKTTAFETDHPVVLSAEAFRTLQLRFRAIADRMTTELAASLRSAVNITLEELKTTRLKTCVDGMPARTTIFVVDVQELPLPGFIRVDSETVTSMIDRLLGGRGISSEMTRELTSIEVRVMRDVVQMVVSQHQNAISQIKTVNMRWTKCYGTPDEMRPLPLAEIYVAADYKIEIEGNIHWNMSFGMPIGPLCPAIESVSALPVRQQESREDRRTRMQKALTGVPVEAAVTLGGTSLTLDDVLHLDVGDIILLDRRKADLFDFSIEGITKYRGRIGRSNNTMTFKVVEALAVGARPAEGSS